jgi:rhodanese-related sulfurtransferase
MKRLVILLIASLFASGALAQVEATAASERMAEVVFEASQEGWMQIGVDDAADYLFQVEPFLLDVRTQGEYDDNGYIEGAVLVPVTELADSHDMLPGDLDTPILVYCAAGTRGNWALVYLTSLGYTNVQNMRGGIGAWVDAGFPVGN